uniref:WD40 repeat-like protein n=1 Tax=Psilocybe cubensis TaxID=181762 RepID=A0A8H8CL03_PSICU
MTYNKPISCVNALSWAHDGNVLLTAGDDTTVRTWCMRQTNTSEDYPFFCGSVLETGHRGNIFSAKVLPFSSRIATAAGDMQVRVFDAATALNSSLTHGDDVETTYSANNCNLRTLRCHHDSVKKIITEESPDLFLSVSEDGTVRQHDLRTSHTCSRRACPEPLVTIGHELCTLSLSPLVPYQFVVAGEGRFGYLYDRRHLCRKLETDWGSLPRVGEELTTCVRKFGRERLPPGVRDIGREHITGSRMSMSNGYEIILSYSRDGVYLFSTKDEPTFADSHTLGTSSTSAPNTNSYQILDPNKRENFRDGNPTLNDIVRNNEPPVSSEGNLSVPVVFPRRRYVGARNVMTVKDVNFLGPDDDWVASGSDDGNFFIWNKANGSLKGIYEGDGSVVNVIEGHPHLPLIAVSGIDTTLFAPTTKPSAFSRTENAEAILETNQRMSATRPLPRFRIASLLGDVNIVVAATPEDGEPSECIGQ